MRQTQADQLAQARRLLLADEKPTVTSQAEALRALARIEAHGGELLARALQEPAVDRPEAIELAGYHRRRAYVWARLAGISPEFEATAAAAVLAWQQAETKVTAQTSPAPR